MRNLIVALLVCSIVFVNAKSRDTLGKSKHFTRMEALSLILNDAKNNPVQILSSSIEKFEASIKMEQAEESKEAKGICTANFRANVTLSGEYNAIEGCDVVSRCAVEAKESITDVTSLVGNIDAMKSEISLQKSKLGKKRLERTNQKNALHKHREQFDEFKRKNDMHVSNHNDAKDALHNIKAVLVRSNTISASKKDKLAISREPIAAPIMRFLENNNKNGLLRDSIVQDIVNLIDKLIASLEKACQDQKEQFDLHVSLLEDAASELREHIGDLSVDIENLEDALDGLKAALNKMGGKLTTKMASFKKRMDFCKRSFDIYVKASSDRSDELKLIRQIKIIVHVHLSKDKLAKANLRYKNEQNTKKSNKDMDDIKKQVKQHEQLQKLKAKREEAMKSSKKKVDEEVRKKKAAEEEYSKEADKKAKKLSEAAGKADEIANANGLKVKMREENAKVAKTKLLEKQHEELKKSNMRLLHDQQRKHREELSKKNEQLLNQQKVKNDGKEAEELKKQIQRNAAIIQHRTALKSEEINKSKNEQSIKDDTTRALKQVIAKKSYGNPGPKT